MSGEKTNEPEWIVPASIPFEGLKAKDLEECTYWLLDAMGAQDIEWRVGGEGGGAADGGRDIEAKILTPDTTGDLAPQTWWFECKGRTRTVEQEAVKSAAYNALAYSNVDVLTIVTNTRFSNPTTDWVKKWNASQVRPQLKLWDRSHLERLVSRQPAVALRLFSESLSLHGRLEVMRSRFWNHMEYSPAKVLEDLWEQRQHVEIDALARFALIANEFANRSIDVRPWGVVASPDELRSTLHTALANVPYLSGRLIRAGANQHPIFRALTYLLFLGLQKMRLDDVVRVIEIFMCESDGKALPKEIIDIFLGPILNNLLVELTDVCVPDCGRVTRMHSGDKTAEGEVVDQYWHRFDAAASTSVDDRVLWLIREDAPCNVGMRLLEDESCPLMPKDTEASNLRHVLGVAKHVISARMLQFRERQRIKTMRAES